MVVYLFLILLLLCWAFSLSISSFVSRLGGRSPRQLFSFLISAKKSTSFCLRLDREFGSCCRSCNKKLSGCCIVLPWKGVRGMWPTLFVSPLSFVCFLYYLGRQRRYDLDDFVFEQMIKLFFHLNNESHRLLRWPAAIKTFVLDSKCKQNGTKDLEQENVRGSFDGPCLLSLFAIAIANFPPTPREMFCWQIFLLNTNFSSHLVAIDSTNSKFNWQTFNAKSR